MSGTLVAGLHPVRQGADFALTFRPRVVCALVGGTARIKGSATANRKAAQCRFAVRKNL
jgi:hypothetical protein